MSNKQESRFSNLSEKELIESLEQPTKLVELIKKLIESLEKSTKTEKPQKEKLPKLWENTTRSSFRKIHEYVTSAIDKAIEIFTRQKEIEDKDIDRISLIFSQTLIFVNYQRVRGQLNDDLARGINSMVNQVLKELNNVKSSKEKRNVERLLRILESMRTIMDTLLVVIYKHVRR